MKKNKNSYIKNPNLAIYLMSLASIAGVMELPAHFLKDSVVAPPKLATVVIPLDKGNPNPMQREKEEVGENYVSYSESQRTPGRAGKY